ncbi:hypothetical protein AB3X52_06665 [Nocardioides sp. DS6]|uniref:Exo-alpha-sialidase n=1 Tax=Nocardioides eburneus TaxID=3231482 RepID=A0ABV3SXV7_9ACTN
MSSDASPDRPGTPPAAVSAVGGKPARSSAPVPVPGWASEVVPAGGSAAYVVGWRRDQSPALWEIDAGGDLSPRTPPPGAPGNPGPAGADSVLDLAFDTPETGLAITATGRRQGEGAPRSLFATDDGARTWTRVDLPAGEQPVRVALGGGAAYVLTGNCPRPGAACDHATLWTIDPTGHEAPRTFDTLPARTDVAGPITAAAFGAAVWVFLNAGTGAETALRSDDGGRAWRRIDTGLCLTERPVATSAGVLWATCATGMLEHFVRQDRDARPTAVFEKVGGTTSSALFPLSDTTAYAVIAPGRGARVEATRDGGRTTSTLARIPRAFQRRGFHATFVSERIGYLITLNGGRLYATVDAAQSWRQVPPPA